MLEEHLSEDDLLKRRALALLDTLLDLDPQTRDARLRECQAQDTRLAALVERLLSLDGASDPRLDLGVDALFDAVAREDSSEDPLLGSRIGPWRLERRLGRGGMGVVYRAERVDGQFQQACALKLIRLDLDHPGARERFLRERQILARLRHPNIAALLDGGITERQQPWFSMELVEGERLDRWCDARRLGVRERVRLFQQVLDAVRYAHGQLVVHRDLKPSNILVTDKGAVKLLDFGVAKLMDIGEEATQTVEHVLTPEYAAPEQLTGGPISTATDLYTLGLLLHVLLAGAHPIGCGPGFSIAQRLARLDREPEPLPRTAARLPPDLAQARRSTPKALARALRGDLAAIVGRCLEADPERRYSSVDALIADLNRWLDDRPVLARNGRLPYRIHRFVRRHRWGLAGAFLFVALITGFVWNRQQLLNRVEAERDNSEAVLSFVVSTIDQGNPLTAGNPEITLREVMDLVLKRLDQDTRLAPDVRGRLLSTIGNIYATLGLNEEGHRLIERAVATFESDDAGKALALAQLSVMMNASGQNDRLVQYMDEALAIMERAPKRPRNLETHAKLLAYNIRLHVQLADLEPGRVLAMAQRAEALLASVPAPEPQSRIDVLWSLTDAYWYAGRREEALASLERAFAVLRTFDQPDSFSAMKLRIALLEHLMDSGKFEQARKEALDLIELATKLLGPDNRLLGFLKANYASALDGSDQTAASIEPTEEAMHLYVVHGGEGSPHLELLRTVLAERLLRVGQSRRAEEIAHAVRTRLKERLDEPVARIAYARTLALIANQRLLADDATGAHELIEQGQQALSDMDASRQGYYNAGHPLLAARIDACLMLRDLECAERLSREALQEAQAQPAAIRDRLLAQRALALARIGTDGGSAEGARLLQEARSAALAIYGECSAVTRAMEADAPLLRIAALQAPPPPRCRHTPR